MSLKSITDAIAADLALSVTGVAFGFGGENVDQHGDAPRIVWVPRGGPTSAPQGPGQNPRPLWTWEQRVEAHVWGRSTSPTATTADHFAAAEALLNALVASAHHVAHGAYRLGSAEWPVLNSQQMAYGRVVVAEFVFQVPLVDSTTGTARAKTTTTHVI